jgi:hypothetical protein
MATVFTDDAESRKRDIARMASTYNLDNFDEVCVHKFKYKFV